MGPTCWASRPPRWRAAGRRCSSFGLVEGKMGGGMKGGNGTVGNDTDGGVKSVAAIACWISVSNDAYAWLIWSVIRARTIARVWWPLGKGSELRTAAMDGPVARR